MARRQDRLTVDDVNGAWAIIPTPAIATAEDWRTEDSVDYDEVAKAVEGLICYPYLGRKEKNDGSDG